jgi:hypothetical protein
VRFPAAIFLLALLTEAAAPDDTFLPEGKEFMQLLLWPQTASGALAGLMASGQAAATARQWVPQMIAQRVMLYNEGGHGISACGRFVVAVVNPEPGSGPNLAEPQGADDDEEDAAAAAAAMAPPARKLRLLAVFSLDPRHVGRLLRFVPLLDDLGIGITCVKFSPASSHIVLGYGVQNRPVLPGSGAAEKRTLVVYSHDELAGMRLVQSLTSASDDLNIAIFNTVPGGGIVVGTRNGNLRVLG